MLTERVTRHLLGKGKIKPRQLEEARRMQSFFGGQIESHLLKLGFVDEDSLGEALTEASGVPYASGDLLRSVSPEALAAIPPSVAERHNICPLHIEDLRLRVAMLNPRDARTLSELQALSGCTVEPWITSEFRLYQALERHYRIRKEGIRSISLAPPTFSRAKPAARPEPSDGATGERPQVEVGLDGRPLDAEMDFEDQLIYQRSPIPEAIETAAARETKGASAPRVEASVPEPAPPSSVDPLAVLEEGMISAANRDELASALLDFCATRSLRSALFAVGRDGVRGVTGRGRGFEPERLRSLSLPPDASNIFASALRSRDFYFGVVPPLPANRDLYTYLGGKLPSMVLVLPILVRERTVALLYLDDENRPMTHPDIPLMRRVAAKAGLAFELLLFKNKLREV